MFDRKKTFSVVLGEVTLIVVGILLALQIENWNEQRKETEFKNDTLKEIHASLMDDKQHIESRIARLEDIANSMVSLSDHLERNGEYSQQIENSFERLSYSLVLELKTGSYETLKVSGLEIIDNPELRSELVNIYDYQYPRMQWMINQEFNYPNQTVFSPFYYQWSEYVDKPQDRTFYLSRVKDYQRFVNDKDLKRIIRRKSNAANGLISRLERLMQRVGDLSKAIEKELE